MKKKLTLEQTSYNYSSWFVAKLSWKQHFFLKKYTLQNIFTKYTLFAEKMFLYGKKSFILNFFLLKKNFFCREKYKWKCKNIYISFEKYIFVQKMFVLQMKFKSFLNIYSLCKKIFFLIIKNIFVKKLLWTQQSGP